MNPNKETINRKYLMPFVNSCFEKGDAHSARFDGKKEDISEEDILISEYMHADLANIPSLI